MELDQNLREKLSALDDAALTETAIKIGREMGVPPRVLCSFASDSAKIRETLAQIRQEDFDKVATALGEDKAESLIETLRREVGTK